MTAATRPLRIGVSSCLLGLEVRYDGGHKRDAVVAETLSGGVEFVPVCPEVEVGMGTPREPVVLRRDGAGVRMVAAASGRDWTAAMRAWADRRVTEITAADLDAFVLKSDSPSCGLERVKVHDDAAATRSGRGLFAAALIAALPLLPAEEEGRLADPLLRDNFLERAFAYRRLKRLLAPGWTLGGLVAFHAAHKLQLMAHSPAAYRELGRLVAAASERAGEEFGAEYGAAFMRALAAPATPQCNANALMHVLGYFKRRLGAAERAEALRLIEEYRLGRAPLEAPLALLRRHLRTHAVAYLAAQTYLEPEPEELQLRDRARPL